MFKIKDRIDLSMWTKNYTIMTLGSFISLMGNASVSFVLGIMVLDSTDSVFLYGLYSAAYYVANVIVPLFAGVLLDRISRKKIIYVLDFCSAGMFFLIYLMLSRGLLNYAWIIGIALILGLFNCCYTVAFGSLYPTLVKKEDLQKAYSVYSMLSMASKIVVPLAAFVYAYFDTSYIFLIASALYFLAAIAETIPKIYESHIEQNEYEHSLKSSIDTIKEGFSYLISKKVLLLVAIISLILKFGVGADNTVLLPYLRKVTNNEQGYIWYIVVNAFYSSGYFIGGVLNTRVVVPKNKKTITQFILYLNIAIIGGIYLFFPISGMIGFMFLFGLLECTSYTIEMTAVQKEVDDSYKGRYTGVTASMMNLGLLGGYLISGAATEFLNIPDLMLSIRVISVVLILIIFTTHWNLMKQLFDKE